MIRSITRYQEILRINGLRVHIPSIVQTLSEDELIECIGEFDGWIIGDDPATERVFAAGRKKKLRAAVKWGVGTDNVDFDGAKAFGFAVLNTPRMFGDEVADIAMGYVVALARKTFKIHAGILAGEWPKPVGLSLKGCVVALVGLGDIGQQTANRLLAAKMKIIGYDPVYGESLPNVERANWPERIEEADFLVLTCSLTPSSRHMVNGDLLRRCKSGVRIINVSRGGLIDEHALTNALEVGLVESAAFEVFEVEPLPPESNLRRFRQCLFGSHNASNTQEAVDRTSMRAIELLSKMFEECE